MTFGGGGIPISFLKSVILRHLAQKVLKLAKISDFQAFEARNTDFWRSDEKPYILGRHQGCYYVRKWVVWVLTATAASSLPY